ncbi:response regulator [Pseudoalteromonas sp. YIC-656]|uniref:response regulator transcription factor n=1 Tax=Pseudoalteromonas pernae TaxID=3118054 RepID=UPI0032424EBD
MNILLIEDDSVFAQTLMRRLISGGCTVSHAANSSEALLQARAVRPTHIILDMNLDSESGLALLAPLRALLPATRIVLLTGFASIATAVQAIKLGADDYLCKPASLAMILATLNGQASDDSVSEGIVMSPDRVEWEHIQAVLGRNDGNISKTARQLNMHRRTLQRKLQKKPVSS